MSAQFVRKAIERCPDGTLPSLTAKQQAQVRRLVKCCCNHDSGKCLLLDDGMPCVCPQSVSDRLVCRHFRWAVLPEDPELEAAILRKRPTLRCQICGTAFTAGSNRAKYCRECASRVHTRQKTAAARKRRSGVDK